MIERQAFYHASSNKQYHREIIFTHDFTVIIDRRDSLHLEVQYIQYHNVVVAADRLGTKISKHVPGPASLSGITRHFADGPFIDMHMFTPR